MPNLCPLNTVCKYVFITEWKNYDEMAYGLYHTIRLEMQVSRFGQWASNVYKLFEVSIICFMKQFLNCWIRPTF